MTETHAQAIENLRKDEQAEPTQAEIDSYVSASDGDITKEQAKDALIELRTTRAALETGEFTKGIRETLNGSPSDSWLRKQLREACDHLDALSERIAELDETNRNNVSCYQMQVKEQVQEIAELKAEINANRDSLLDEAVEKEELAAENKTQQQKIERLKVERDEQPPVGEFTKNLRTLGYKVSDASEGAMYLDCADRLDAQQEEIKCWEAMKEGVEIRMGDMQAEIDRLTAKNIQLQSTIRFATRENKALTAKGGE